MALLNPLLALQQQGFIGGNANKPGATGNGFISRSEIGPMFEEFQESVLQAVFDRRCFPQHSPQEPAQGRLLTGKEGRQFGFLAGLGRYLIQTGASLSSEVKMREQASLFEGK
jgi:hypothetical protein